jgi:hypothetical protein
MRQSRVGIQVDEPVIVPQVGQAQSDRPALVELIPVFGKHVSVDADNAEVVTEVLSRLVVPAGNDHDVV